MGNTAENSEAGGEYRKGEATDSEGGCWAVQEGASPATSPRAGLTGCTCWSAEPSSTATVNVQTGLTSEDTDAEGGEKGADDGAPKTSPKAG